MQHSRNKHMHSLNGNTVLLLDQLIPCPTQTPPSYDRPTLLSFFSRKSEPSALGFVPVTLQTTPPFLQQQSPSKRKAVSRTGRRIKVFNSSTQPRFYKPKKHASPRDTNQEFTKIQQGAGRRRLPRQSYRRWCRECKQHVPGGADSLVATPPRSTKVSQNNAAKFKRAIDWQQHLQRKQKPTRDRIQTRPHRL